MTKPAPQSRHKAREMAFQFLYGYLDQTGSAAQLFKRSDYEAFCKNFEEQVDEFGWEICEGAGQNIPVIDEAISKVSSNWRIERMPRVDLTILRLAGYEMLIHTGVPRSVSINEAVELAKKFGSEDSPAFVNGILDKLT